MQGTIIREGIATGCIKNSWYLQSFRTVSAAHVHTWSFLACSTWQKHGMANMKAFAPVSLQKALFATMRSTLMFLFYRGAQSCLGRFLLSLQSKPNLSSLLPELWPFLQGTGQTWAASSCGESLLGFPWGGYFAGGFSPFGKFLQNPQNLRK